MTQEHTSQLAQDLLLAYCQSRIDGCSQEVAGPLEAIDCAWRRRPVLASGEQERLELLAAVAESMASRRADNYSEIEIRLLAHLAGANDPVAGSLIS